MGGGNWSDRAYDNLKTTYSKKSTDQIFTTSRNQIDAGMNPKGVVFRESRDSDAHPLSLAVFFGLDETGSMGQIPEYLVRHKLGSLMETLINHKVPDAHILFSGIGDQYSDDFPLQVGQFEAGTEELNEWLTKINLEGRGGGQNMESYSLAWFFAARHTSIDCFEKRGKKGYLFTCGDEWVHPQLEADFLTELMGYPVTENLTAKQVLAEAQRMYHVFHLHCSQTSTGSQRHILDSWRDLLGENCIEVTNYENVAEIVATTVAVMEGANVIDVVKDFDAITAGEVTKSLAKIGGNNPITHPDSGIIKF